MEKTKIESKKINVYYGDKKALSNITLDIPEKKVTSLIGPSGCGKSTFLRCLNRMNDTIDICRIEGKILVDGEDIYDTKLDPVLLRARIGMVFQKPNPFPKSIFDNVAYGPKIHGLTNSSDELQLLVESSLKKAGSFLIGFAIGMPIFNACLGVFVAKALALGPGNALLFVVL